MSGEKTSLNVFIMVNTLENIFTDPLCRFTERTEQKRAEKGKTIRLSASVHLLVCFSDIVNLNSTIPFSSCVMLHSTINWQLFADCLEMNQQGE